MADGTQASARSRQMQMPTTSFCNDTRLVLSDFEARVCKHLTDAVKAMAALRLLAQSKKSLAHLLGSGLSHVGKVPVRQAITDANVHASPGHTMDVRLRMNCKENLCKPLQRTFYPRRAAAPPGPSRMAHHKVRAFKGTKRAGAANRKIVGGSCTSLRGRGRCLRS